MPTIKRFHRSLSECPLATFGWILPRESSYIKLVSESSLVDRALGQWICKLIFFFFHLSIIFIFLNFFFPFSSLHRKPQNWSKRRTSFFIFYYTGHITRTYNLRATMSAFQLFSRLLSILITTFHKWCPSRFWNMSSVSHISLQFHESYSFWEPPRPSFSPVMSRYRLIVRGLSWYSKAIK